MTNQNIRCWQEAPLGYLGPLSVLTTPVNSWETLKGGSRASIAPSLAKQFYTIRGVSVDVMLPRRLYSYIATLRHAAWPYTFG